MRSLHNHQYVCENLPCPAKKPLAQSAFLVMNTGSKVSPARKRADSPFLENPPFLSAEAENTAPHSVGVWAARHQSTHRSDAPSNTRLAPRTISMVSAAGKGLTISSRPRAAAMAPSTSTDHQRA